MRRIPEAGLVKKLLTLFLLIALRATAQVNYGELRLKIADPSGAGIQASVELTCAGNGYDETFTSDPSGTLAVQTMPYGVYQIQIKRPGFAPYTTSVELRSALPVAENIRLTLASVLTNVTVEDRTTLIDPYYPASVMQIGAKQIQERLSSLPGRSVQDLVNTQPGWLYEGNAVLHPRGSEYQTQFVIDGIPLTDNRSPSFGPEIEADDLDSVSIYTAGYPAEYGRKMGGVVELNTRRQTDAGLHGQLVLSGGSYDSASAYGQLQKVWGRNTLSGTASGGTTAHYLNPVVPENFTNTGTPVISPPDTSATSPRGIASASTCVMSSPASSSRTNFCSSRPARCRTETTSRPWASSTISTSSLPIALIALAGMVRDNANDLYSNAKSTPIIAFQKNDFREGYFKGTLSLHHHRIMNGSSGSSRTQPFFMKTSTTASLIRRVRSGHATALTFAAQRPDLEQSAFVEDMIQPGELDLQRWLALGPLSAPSQSERVQPPGLRWPLSAFARHGASCLLRSHLSDAVLRKHPDLQLSPDRCAQR